MLFDLGLEFLRVEFAPVSPAGFRGQRAGFGGVQIPINGTPGQVEPPGGLGFGAARFDEVHHPFPQVQRICFHALKPITLCPNVNVKCYNTGNIYVADYGNNAIRKVTQAGVVTTLAGLSSDPDSADGIGSVVRFNGPAGVAVDASGDLFIADSRNETIRATQSLTNRIDQIITFTPLPNKSASDAPFTLSATASSGLPVYLNVLAGPAVLDTNNVLTLLGAGTVTVVAWQPGNSTYNAAVPVQQSFNVSPIPQTITFGSLSQQKVGDAPFSLSATSDSGLPVSFSVSGPAVLNGNILALTGWGTVTVTASQPGNASYMAATNVVQSFFVIPPDNTIVGPQFSSGGFQLAFYGLTGSNYLIQTSTNLVNWQPFTNFVGTNSLLYFDDPSATNFKQRFYRTVRP